MAPHRGPGGGGGRGVPAHAAPPPEQLVCGRHAVSALLEHHPREVACVWLQDTRRDAAARGIAAAAARGGIELRRLSRRELDGLARGLRHQGFIARCHRRAPPLTLAQVLARATRPPLVLVLDGVQDPHNLGACLRSAEAAGAEAVVVPRRRAAGLSAAVRRAAAGAAETLPLLEAANLARSLEELREAGLRVVGAAGDARRSLYEAELGVPLALVLGGEERGLRRLTRERCDELVRIPMAGAVASLNVSVAAAVCLFEVRRRLAAAGAAP